MTTRVCGGVWRSAALMWRSSRLAAKTCWLLARTTAGATVTHSQKSGHKGVLTYCFLCVCVCILLSGLAVRHNEELKGVIWGRCVRGLHHRQVKVIVQKTKAHDLLHTGSVRVWVKFKDCPSRTRVIYYMIHTNCCDDHQHRPQQSEYSDKEQINIFWWRSRLLFSL